jgi:ATP-dependent Clp protease ATP-binding subunit ClpA
MRKRRQKTKSKQPLPGFFYEYASYEHLLRSRFLGIDDACGQVAALMASHLIGARLPNRPVNARCLIIGPTSSGKSSLVTEAADLLNAPFVTINCSGLTPEGYKGTNLSEALASLVAQRESRGKSYAESHGIVLLDEFDKLWLSQDDNFKKPALAALLPLLGGEPMLIPSTPSSTNLLGDQGSELPTTLKTKGLLIFCAGVFSKIPNRSRDSIENAVPALLRFGIPRELCSRLTHLIPLHRPNKDVIEEVIERQATELAPLYQTNGTIPTLCKSRKRRIALTTLSHPLGIRFARSLLHREFLREATEVDS